MELLEEFEDVPFEMTAAELYGIYRAALVNHLMRPAGGAMHEAAVMASKALEKLEKINESMETQRKSDTGLHEAQNIVSSVRRDIVKMKEQMAYVRGKMDKAEKAGPVKAMKLMTKKKANVDAKVAQVETKMAAIRSLWPELSPEEDVVEATGSNGESRSVVPASPRG